MDHEIFCQKVLLEFGGWYAQHKRRFSIACGISIHKMSVLLGSKSYLREAPIESEIYIITVTSPIGGNGIYVDALLNIPREYFSYITCNCFIIDKKHVKL